MNRRIIRQRKCIVCGNRTNQSELVRISLSGSRELEIGGVGRQLGRGAYLCRSRGCFEGAIRTNRLGKALRSEMADRWKADLGEYLGREELPD